MEALILASAIFLIAEGLMPLINPQGWRRVLSLLQSFRDGQLRFIGFFMVTAGVLLYVLFA